MNAPPTAVTDTERRIISVMEPARNSGRVYLQVSAESGRMPRLLTEVSAVKSVVESGSSTGSSRLCFCLGLVNTDGKLTTFEIDRSRGATARQHFVQAGVQNRVTLIEGDAHENSRSLNGPIDILFLDADKQGHPDYLNRLLPSVRQGGLMVAGNIGMAPDYAKVTTTRRNLETVFFGKMAITLKKRTSEAVGQAPPFLRAGRGPDRFGAALLDYGGRWTTARLKQGNSTAAG
jgi:predicted O-methyltransferase YrrM